jgi:general secretion pathway protein J
MKRRVRARGFTLVELLVSVFLLTVLSALAYETLAYVHRARDGAIAAIARERELEVAVHTLVADFEQLVPRPVRQPIGAGYLPALALGGTGTELVTLTRGGWSNGAGVQRPTLQRVTYVLDAADHTLYRSYTPALDATLATPTIKRALLKDVVRVQLRLMDGARQWQTQWPPPGGNPLAGTASPVAALRILPIAVEITLELKDYGTIVRLVETPG